MPTIKMFADTISNDSPGLITLGQLSAGGSWRVELAHHHSCHLLIWMTRGQGLALMDGGRRGIGAHNAMFVPANSLVSLDVGRLSAGQVLAIPDGTDLTLPSAPVHLRVRDLAAQAELTTLLETLGREQGNERPLLHEAANAYAGLVGIWLRRQMFDSAHPVLAETAARRLSRSFCRRLVLTLGSGETMAEHAAALGVTPTHLTRVCKAETGRTAAALLTEQHLHAARKLLSETRVPVKNIARNLGFGSAAYFTRFIQQHTGLSPLALRRHEQRADAA